MNYEVWKGNQYGFGDIFIFDTYTKHFIEHSKTDEYREKAWVTLLD